jgi:hypothetical protein
MKGEERMNRRRLSVASFAVLLILLFAGSPAWAACSSAAKTWECYEGTFPIASQGNNPYRDLKVRVDLCPGQVCTSSDPNKLTTYAFWDGVTGQLKFRTAFPSTGIWFWTATCEAGCSFTAGGQTPSIQAYSGTNPLYQYGFLERSANGRFLKHKVPNPDSSERPFFWLGDTTWSGPLRVANTTSWSNYLTDRKNRGFSVIQVALPVDWMQTTGQVPRYGTSPGQPAFHKEPCGSGTAEDNVNPMPRSISCWNPSFWQTFEQRIAAANDLGLVVAIVGLAEGVVQSNANGVWCPPALTDSEVFARNIAARFAGNHVIFSPAFDRYSGSNICALTAGAGVTSRMQTIGNVVSTAAPRHLVTNHWASQTSGNEVLGLQDQAWLDFQLFQSGQAGYVCAANGDPTTCRAKQLATLSCRARQLALCVWNRACTASPSSCPDVSEPSPVTAFSTKPGVNGESIYDGMTSSKASLGSTHYNPLNARRTGYYSLLSGATGYTFGIDGIFNWGISPKLPSNVWVMRSNNHMQHLSGLFRSVNFKALTPDQSILLTPQPAEEHRKITVSRGGGGAFMIAYLPDNPSIQLNFTNFSALRTNGRWLNPRTGTYTTAVPSVSGFNYTYTRPSAPPACPATLSCSTEGPSSDPCYCTDASDPNRGERDWVLVIP